jgi:hypothetical protein
MNATFDQFLHEIEASPKFVKAAAADAAWAERLECLRTSFCGLEQLADVDTRAVALLDKATVIIKSESRLKLRFVRVFNVLAETSRIFDPAGGAPDLPIPSR